MKTLAILIILVLAWTIKGNGAKIETPDTTVNLSRYEIKLVPKNDTVKVAKPTPSF